MIAVRIVAATPSGSARWRSKLCAAASYAKVEIIPSSLGGLNGAWWDSNATESDPIQYKSLGVGGRGTDLPWRNIF
jgi:hypothetical protein